MGVQEGTRAWPTARAFPSSSPFGGCFPRVWPQRKSPSH